MGSGGGGAHGGQGGGVLHISARKVLTLASTGSITSNGGDAVSNPGEGGSGGGSGGSILLEFGAVRMTGLSSVQANGGAGAAPGGGGGGGGLIHLQPPPFMPYWPRLLDRGLETRIAAPGGGGGAAHAPGSPSAQESGEAGENLRFTTQTNCTEGHYGPLCYPCWPGSAKDTRGPKDCINCSAGSYQPHPGGIHCERCELGKVSHSGASGCSYCELGNKEVANGTDCVPCGNELPRYAHWHRVGMDGCRWECNADHEETVARDGCIRWTQVREDDRTSPSLVLLSSVCSPSLVPTIPMVASVGRSRCGIGSPRFAWACTCCAF
jgi:hypothetical protein